jgi:hypothetical protein
MSPIKEFIEKIRPFYEKNRTWIVWGGTVLLVSAMILIAVLWGRNEPVEPLTLIETPLQYDVSHTLVVGKDKIEESDLPGSLDVFKIVSRNYHQDIDGFLRALGQKGYAKDSLQTALYTWNKGDSYVEYVPDSQNLYFRFEDAAQTGIDLRVDSRDSGAQFLSQYYKKLFDRDYDFVNVTVDTVGSRTRIEGNREVNGYPMFVRANNDYTDYLIIDSDGKVYEGNNSLVEYTDDGSQKVDLVDISNLQFAMSKPDYPKEVIQLYGPSEDPDREEREGDSNGIDEFEDDPPIATGSTLESIELVYYFSDISLTQLSPTFRVMSNGVIRHNDRNVEVELLIYANALDPDRVYIPSEE